MSGASIRGFVHAEVPTAEIDAIEEAHAPLVSAVRDLVDVAIRTTVPTDTVADAAARVREVVTMLEAEAHPGPVGVSFNNEGRAWNWGNAAVGRRNAVAPPMAVEQVEPGHCRAALDLGAPYEGQPGIVHGGISALLLDHLLGETASMGYTKIAVTGTLTLRYVDSLPLGPVELEGRVERQEGRKLFLRGTIGAPGSVAIEAEGVWIVPRWAAGEDLDATATGAVG